MKRVLLVTGSRALMAASGGNDAAESWARVEVHGYVSRKPRPDLVVNGGCASSPDFMASSWARVFKIPSREFRLDGAVYDWNGQSSRWRDGPATSPLVRNIAMVAAVAKLRDDGWSVQVLGLVAPWSRTHGTDHTLTLARKAGMDVIRLECPVKKGGGT